MQEFFEKGDYPFGMMMPNRSYTAASGYRYGFNGKENDNEVKGEGNEQDYGMRVYDPRLGRFLSVDPLTKKYPELTPYQYANNTPIQAIDLDGLEDWAANVGFGLKRQAQMGVDAAKFNAQKSVQVQFTVHSQPAHTSSQSTGTMQALDMSHDAVQRRQEVSDQNQQAKNLRGATMDPLAGGIAYQTFTTGKAAVQTGISYVQNTVQHGKNIVEGVQEGNYWKAGKNTGLLALDVAPFIPLLKGSAAVQSIETGVAYRAVNAEYAASTAKSGFYLSGNAGRLGSDGLYANSSIEGAIAEFKYHNPGVTPVVFEVKYTVGKTITVPPASGYTQGALPGTEGYNIIQAQSLRAPGTTNLLIRSGATPGKIVN